MFTSLTALARGTNPGPTPTGSQSDHVLSFLSRYEIVASSFRDPSPSRIFKAATVTHHQARTVALRQDGFYHSQYTASEYIGFRARLESLRHREPDRSRSPSKTLAHTRRNSVLTDSSTDFDQHACIRHMTTPGAGFYACLWSQLDMSDWSRSMVLHHQFSPYHRRRASVHSSNLGPACPTISIHVTRL